MDIVTYAKLKKTTNKLSEFINVYDVMDINEAYAAPTYDLCLLSEAYQTAVTIVNAAATSGEGLYVTATVTSVLVNNGSAYTTANIPVASSATKADIATAIAVALNADVNVNPYFTATALSTGETSGEVQIITKDTAAFDPTLKLDINAGNSGITASTSKTCQPNVHPSILNIPQGWNGYKYWMAITPLPYAANMSGDSTYENPTIYASNDLVSWVVPAGVTNPVIAKPSSGYYADPVLTLDLDGSTVWLTYKYSGSNDQFITVSSTDGFKTISTPTILLTFNTPMSEKSISPAILADRDHNEYIMWSVNFVTSPATLVRRTCSTMTGTWSEGEVCNIVMPTGRYLWHIDIKKLGEVYYMLIQDSSTNGTSSASRFLFGSSSDGIEWTINNQALMVPIYNSSSSGGLYKGTILPTITDKGIAFHLWYSNNFENYYGFSFHHTVIMFDKTQRNLNYRNDILSGIHLFYPSLFCDLMGTDGVMGTASCGKLWTADVGTFNVSGGYASPTSAINTIATYDLGVKDFCASMKIGDINNAKWLLFRYVSSSSFLRLGIGEQGDLHLQQVGTDILEIGRCAIGDILGVKCQGDLISVYVNDELRGTVTNSYNNTATKFGIQASTTGAKIGEVFARAII